MKRFADYDKDLQKLYYNIVSQYSDKHMSWVIKELNELDSEFYYLMDKIDVRLEQTRGKK